MSEHSKSDDGNTDALGYGNPPKAMRFRPGQSGNPKGRPKGSLNMATVLERTLREKVIITEGGKRRTINKLEAAVTQLTDKAAAGDLKAVQMLTALVRSAEERAGLQAIPDAVSEEVDARIVLGILKRIETTSKEDPENADEIVTE
jgi:Family of unknown function (DUF5681)